MRLLKVMFYGISISILCVVAFGCSNVFVQNQFVGHYRYFGGSANINLEMKNDGNYILSNEDAKLSVSGKWTLDEISGEQMISFADFHFPGGGSPSWFIVKPMKSWLGKIRFNVIEDDGTYFEKRD